MGTEEFTGKNNIQPDAVVPDKQLKIHIDKFAAPLSARFRLQKLPLKKLTPEHLPLNELLNKPIAFSIVL
ncbi:hypothetical protein [Candidatus Regiella insecticola]|uniref:hypothetical protein n=1 Tax=Candidatus Regiella insecticola TaxID=138073 RepID=UPI001596E754|nr:hypothetical protein [Candidatus Regiella insecticola]